MSQAESELEERMQTAELRIKALTDCAVAMEKRIEGLYAAKEETQKQIGELPKVGICAPIPDDRVFLETLQATRGVKPFANYEGDVGTIVRMRAFIHDLLDADVFGCEVSRGVRDAAKKVLGMTS